MGALNDANFRFRFWELPLETLTRADNDPSFRLSDIKLPAELARPAEA